MPRQPEAGRGGEERRGAARGCPALGQRGDAWRSGASRTHVSRRGDRPASLHVPGGPPRWNSPGSAICQLVLKAPRALHGAAFPPGDLNPHHLVLGCCRWTLRVCQGRPLSPSHALLPKGVNSSLISTGFSCGFHLEPQRVQHIVISKTNKQTNKHLQKLGHSF